MSFAAEFLDIAVIVAFVAVAVGQILAMVRLVIGPETGDRILTVLASLLAVSYRGDRHRNGQGEARHRDRPAEPHAERDTAATACNSSSRRAGLL